MIFSSPEFILLFLPISFFGYFWLNSLRYTFAAKAWLVALSLYFYAYWNLAYLPLLLGSILFNYAAGTALAKPPGTLKVSRKAVLVFAVVANLAFLAYFKYANFFIENVNWTLGTHYEWPQILLPLGISFFTFTQIAYLVDSYRGEVKEYDLLNYSLFVTFFPHLIAGPILHHKEMMSQFRSRWTWAVRYKNIFLGLFIFAIGLFKKVIIADTFAVWANAGFDGGVALDFWAAWAASLAYTFQLYFDFSGYCDMAIGASLLFNIWLPINFNSPYKALDIQDFWRRWHMTLSRYLRDYLYIPLGGNRSGKARMYFNLFATFLLGGLWHGASWMFVIWGALHGGALVIHRVWSHELGLKLPKWAAWTVTFLFVNVTWVFFRAHTWADAKRILVGMVDVSTAGKLPVASVPTEHLAWGGWFSDNLLRMLPTGLAAQALPYAAIVLAFWIIAWRNSCELVLGGTIARWRVVGAWLMFCVALYATMVTTSTVFLYFNF
jgi:alginate O-acetyltransferase complex protein AlgI